VKTSYHLSIDYLLDTDWQTIPNRNVTWRNIKIVIGKSKDLWL